MHYYNCLKYSAHSFSYQCLIGDDLGGTGAADTEAGVWGGKIQEVNSILVK